jgi:protein O-mannosyl-transferase
VGAKRARAHCDGGRCRLVLSRQAGVAAAVVVCIPALADLPGANIASYAGTLAVAALLCLLWWKRKQPGVQPLFVAFVYFLLALLPVLGLVNHFFLIYSLVADHFQYLASIGPLALAGLAFWRAFDFLKFEARWLRLAAGAGLLAVVGTMSWNHARIFHDSETLWRDTLAKNPGSWMAENNLGLLMNQRGNFAEEKIHYERSLRLNPENADALANLGGILVEEGRVDEALAYLHRALQLQPRYKPAQKNYAAALYAQGRYDEAITLLQALVRQDANDVPVLTNLALAFAKKEQWADAIDCYEKVLRLDPQNATGHYNLAKLLLKTGRTLDAAARFENVLRLMPGQAEVHCELADVLRQLGRTSDAIGHLHEALRLKPDLAEARRQLRGMGIRSP